MLLAKIGNGAVLLFYGDIVQIGPHIGADRFDIFFPEGCLLSVSYTHLDVYKRQHLDRAFFVDGRFYIVIPGGYRLSLIHILRQRKMQKP